MGQQEQNVRYQSSSSTRNVGSDPSRSTVNRAVNTALGKNSNRNFRNLSQQTFRDPKRGISRELNLAGLQNSLTARVQMNNSGYVRSGRSRAEARQSRQFYGTLQSNITNNGHDTPAVRVQNQVINNTGLGSKGSSISIMKSRNRLDERF